MLKSLCIFSIIDPKYSYNVSSEVKYANGLIFEKIFKNSHCTKKWKCLVGELLGALLPTCESNIFV